MIYYIPCQYALPDEGLDDEDLLLHAGDVAVAVHQVSHLSVGLDQFPVHLVTRPRAGAGAG